MGGSLSVQSDGPGKGATFILELPLQPPGSSTDADTTEFTETPTAHFSRQPQPEVVVNA